MNINFLEQGMRILLISCCQCLMKETVLLYNDDRFIQACDFKIMFFHVVEFKKGANFTNSCFLRQNSLIFQMLMNIL